MRSSLRVGLVAPLPLVAVGWSGLVRSGRIAVMARTLSAMAVIEQSYVYLQPSVVRAAEGRTEVMLATSGGRTASEGAEHPQFFDGFIGHPEQAGVALLTCARVARTRFYMPPNMVAAKIRAADPVVTSNGDRIRFESFSACCGVYSRFDVLSGSLDVPPLASGTTNVDFNPPMREALAGIADREPLHLQVGQGGGVTLTTLDSRVVERKVPLPERWIRGFAEVQVASSGMTPQFELSGVEARRFLRTLPASTRRPLWAIPAGRSLRLTTRPVPGAVCVAGAERLRALAPLIRFAKSLRAYGPSVDERTGFAPSAWELTLDDARMVVVLSPEVSRGFSGEGTVLADLSDKAASDDADLISALLAWDPRIEVDHLASAAGLTSDRVVRALVHLGAAGQVGFDLAEGAFYHRELPFNPAVLESMHPRLRDARALVDAGAVRAQVSGMFDVDSGGVTYRVTFTAGGARCTCPWWGKYQGTRGPCKHVLAATVAGRP